ncbi:MAG: EamA family transporter [Spirochaetaceae bacterium]|nr:MAG: EamA family transporter [Spirochaetaceae bacterium]
MPLTRYTLKTVAAYLTIYIVWGSTYFFIKLALESFPPYPIVGVRFTVGGLLLLALGLASSKARRTFSIPSLLSAMLLGTLLLLGANGLVTVAEQKVDSYIVALVMAVVPLAVASFNRFLFRKTITWMRFSGIGIGFCGVVFLLYDGSSFRGSLSPQTLMVLAAMLLWSFGTSLAHRLPLPADSRINSGMQMLFAGVSSTAIALFSGHTPATVFTAASLRSLVGLAYLGIVGSLAMAAYAYLLVNEPSIRIVSYALVNPGIAVLLGFLFGHETAVPYLLVGFPLILVGLTVMLYGESLLKSFRKRREQAS